MKTRGLRLKLSALFLAVAASIAMAFPMAAYAVELNDVPDTHWAKKQGVIDGIAELGIIKGVTNSDGSVSFQPDAKVTRAQIAVMLCRYANADVAESYPANETAWTDVKNNAWYTEAMNWAEAQGVLTGSNGKVRPNDPITRQELATMLCRLAAKEGRDVSYDADRMGKFSDSSKIAGWAKPSVSWAVEDGLMGGAAKLNPTGNATRAEASKMILVFIQGGNDADPLLKARFINVGQGDSAFVELPNGETLLIDAGKADAGDTVVSYIESKGYSKIDHILITHPDADHIGGMAQVIDSFEIGQIYTPNYGSITQTWENLLDTIARKGEKIKAVYSGFEMISDGELTCTVLWPETIGSDSNNNSAILMVDYGDTEWLFTGDAEAGCILDACSQDIDVLKVSHHGGSGCTTPTLVDTLKPEYAVISVGSNSYGHPTEATLSALSSAKVYRTDKSGNITGYSDSSAVWFTSSPSTFVPSGNDDGATGSDDDAADTGSTVCVTKTGSKYHYDWCSALSRSKNLTYMTIAEAEAKGYDPCKVCVL